MRVIRSSGQNVSPSDDGRLYQQAFEDGLFESTTINSLGGNLVSIGAMYGIMQGRDFTVEAQSINVELPSEDDTTGYIYVQFDTTTSDVISVESALAPFTPTYDDINTGGTICQMVIAEYQASAVAVTSITSVYPTATTKTNPTLVGSVAQIETSPATASHSVGQYLFYNKQLYEVTANIAVGETLVVGTNIVATSVGNEISDLKSDINSVESEEVTCSYLDGKMSFKKRGGVVTATFGGSVLNLPTGNADLGIIPTKFRPANTAEYAYPFTNNQSTLQLGFGHNGTMSVYNYGSAGSFLFRFTIAYISAN